MKHLTLIILALAANVASAEQSKICFNVGTPQQQCWLAEKMEDAAAQAITDTQNQQVLYMPPTPHGYTVAVRKELDQLVAVSQ